MRKWIDLFESATLPTTPENIARAKAFVFEKWKERAAERGEPEPHDLTGSCKFSALFAAEIFGADIEANYDHTWTHNGQQIIDLNADAEDVRQIGPNVYQSDGAFEDSDEFLASLEACEQRVNAWLEEWSTHA